MQSAPVTQVMSNPVASPVMNATTTVSPTTSNTPTLTQPSPMEKKPVTALGRVLSLERENAPSVKQNHNPFPAVSINQEIPLEIRQHNKFLMDLLSSGFINEPKGINQITKDTVEYEQ
jgi:hypothetical protein